MARLRTVMRHHAPSSLNGVSNEDAFRSLVHGGDTVFSNEV
jgi:hypothetical protein